MIIVITRRQAALLSEKENSDHQNTTQAWEYDYLSFQFTFIHFIEKKLLRHKRWERRLSEKNKQKKPFRKMKPERRSWCSRGERRNVYKSFSGREPEYFIHVCCYIIFFSFKRRAIIFQNHNIAAILKITIVGLTESKKSRF